VNRFKALFKQIDTNHNGIISGEELEQHLDDPAVQAYFLSIDIQPHEADTVFSLLGGEPDADIDFEEFILGCMRYKGTARAVDLARVSYENRSLNKRLKQIITDVALCRNKIQDITDSLYKVGSVQWAPMVQPQQPVT